MSKMKDRSVCKEWFAEGRIICCEMITDDGENYYCAHCDGLDYMSEAERKEAFKQGGWYAPIVG